jgi:GNAT superfamily N-acetyltransferase
MTSTLPPLADGYHDLPRGKVALPTVSLQMLTKPLRKPDPPGSEGLRLVRRPEPDTDWYRAIYRRVGEPWMWFSRLRMSEAVLRAEIHDPAVEVFSVEGPTGEIGFLQLDFRERDICELAFFGLVPEAVGGGAGRWLMNRALEQAWSRPITRVWVHTCMADHPAALAFYVRSGFVPFKLQVEVADDPRLTGESPRDASPHIPMLP